jgi:hypothetical protein
MQCFIHKEAASAMQGQPFFLRLVATGLVMGKCVIVARCEGFLRKHPGLFT